MRQLKLLNNRFSIIKDDTKHHLSSIALISKNKQVTALVKQTERDIIKQLNTLQTQTQSILEQENNNA